MAIVGRMELDHPALGTAGGSSLHDSIDAIYESVSDNSNARYEEFSAIADSTLSTHRHNFGVVFAEMKVMLYTGIGTSKVRVADPAGAGWTIAANGSNPKQEIDVTTPGSGGPHSFSLVVANNRGSENISELDDVSISSPVSGEVLKHNGSNWVNGFVSSVSTKTGAYTILDDDGITHLIGNSASNMIFTLPTVADNTGRIINITSINTGFVKLDGEGAEQVDGANDIEIRKSGDGLSVISDGAAWRVVNFFSAEYYEDVSASNQSSSTFDTFFDTDMALTLEPGTYEVGFHACVLLAAVSAGDFALRTGSTVVTNAYMVNDDTTVQVTNSATRTVQIAVTASTTYKLSIRGRLGTLTQLATSVTGGLTDPDNETKIFARRVR